MDVISNISSEDTERIINLSGTSIEKTFDWIEVYGTLGRGNYEFILNNEADSLGIIVSFKINDDGNAILGETEILY